MNVECTNISLLCRVYWGFSDEQTISFGNLPNLYPSCSCESRFDGSQRQRSLELVKIIKGPLSLRLSCSQMWRFWISWLGYRFSLGTGASYAQLRTSTHTTHLHEDNPDGNECLLRTWTDFFLRRNLKQTRNHFSLLTRNSDRLSSEKAKSECSNSSAWSQCPACDCSPLLHSSDTWQLRRRRKKSKLVTSSKTFDEPLRRSLGRCANGMRTKYKRNEKTPFQSQLFESSSNT